jgi:cytochrome c oxidase subunit II
MRVHTYEKAFLWVGAVMLVAFMGALLYASIAMGIHLPGRAGLVDPQLVSTTAPFDDPGVHQTGPGTYDAVVIGRTWSFEPSEIRVPRGSEVTFIVTTPDVIHGFAIEGTRINMMLIPGQVSKNTYTFEEPGEHLLICHEYCGLNHHTMYGRVIVE